MTDREFWRGRRVFLTGHTGFKGSWLSLWLQQLGAEVTGYALDPPTTPSLFEVAAVGEGMNSIIGDVRDLDALASALRAARPEIVFHLAAQPLVRRSYQAPVETYATNVMGTVNLLEAVRLCGGVRAVVNVTSDKCYENNEWVWGYRETDPMGGYDPYSSSKGCAELVTSSFQRSFFPVEKYAEHGVAVASVRAGNVIGGGDWAEDRLVPDILRAFGAGHTLVVRNPQSIRPWQHVLEPLSGYLLLAENLTKHGPAFAGAWNFGPDDEAAKPVRWIVETLADLWGQGASWTVAVEAGPHEANYLKLDCSKAKQVMGWTPKWDLETALQRIVAWQQVMRDRHDINNYTLAQIRQYEALSSAVLDTAEAH